MNVGIILGKKQIALKYKPTTTEAQNLSRSPPSRDHRAVWFIWQEALILITVIISTPAFGFQRSGLRTPMRSGSSAVPGSEQENLLFTEPL